VIDPDWLVKLRPVLKMMCVELFSEISMPW
jgi:hypothetical protein